MRNYFRRVLSVPAGTSRKKLRQVRDKQAGLLRERLLGKSDFTPFTKEELEDWLSLTNEAYDCLCDSEKFRLFQKSPQASQLTELSSLHEFLGVAQAKPLPETVRLRRESKAQEKVERLIALAKIAIEQAARQKYEEVQRHGAPFPEADDFYQAVYDCALAAGNKVKEEEWQILERTKLASESEGLAAIEEELVNQAEIVAHKQYDKLEDLVAIQPKPVQKNRLVAGVLSFVILSLVIGYAVMANFKGAGFVQSNVLVPLDVPTYTEAVGAENSVEPGLSLSRRADEVMALGLASTAGCAGLAGPTGSTIAGAAEYKLGLESAMAGRFNEAIDSFRRASQANRQLLQADYNEATLYLVSKDYSKAVASLGRLITKILTLEAGKNNPAATGCLAQAFYNRALAHQEKANLIIQGMKLRFDKDMQVPNNLQSLERFEAAKDLQAAIANYGLALRLDNRMAQAYYNRGLAQYRFGNSDLAQDDFTQAYAASSLLEAAKFNLSLVSRKVKSANLHIVGKDAPGSVPPTPVGPVGPPGP